ncbi:MAG: sigma 54-interacting transcriptional regulator [Thiobacillus sp.]
MTARQVALLAKDNLFDRLHDLLSTAGWHALRTAEYEATQPLNEHAPVHAGMIQFVDGKKSELSKVESLTAGKNGMAWIALMPPELLLNQSVCRLIKTRFYDFHTLPVDPSRLLSSLGHAHGMGQLHGSESGSADESGQYGMIGSSSAMRKLYLAIDKAGNANDAPVLIGGESGTGKEMVARAIHQSSSRRGAPFVAVNCAALPANLIQSELFGYEKGAFTGATQRKTGRLEAANGGTIFLDEIGDLPLDLQVNLLRVLQEKAIERLGSSQEIHLDVRVIAATHVDMANAVTQGRIREDLYYRLNVLGLTTPPLRERDSDIELLAMHYFKKFSIESPSIALGFSDQALQAMGTYSWPGNVRELINRVRQAVIMSECRLLTPANLGLEKRTHCDKAMTLEQARIRAEDEIIRSTLRRSHNNVTEAARQLGVSRATLYRLIEHKKIQHEASEAQLMRG